MKYHIVVGDEAAKPLLEALFSNEEEEPAEVLVLRDLLHVGPLQKEDGKSFSATRTAFWEAVIANEKNKPEVDDLERILNLGNQLNQFPNRQVWFWLAPWPADMTAYYWLLSYFQKYREQFYVVNVGGLPFIDEERKMFYPKNISEIPAKEITKALKLARQITPSEMEVDTEEWERLKNENAEIRVYEGGKKLSGKGMDYYDAQLVSFCSQQFQKASKIVRQAMSKFAIPTGDVFLNWRLRELAKNNQIKIQGDTTKPLNEWEVKLDSEVPSPTENLPS